MSVKILAAAVVAVALVFVSASPVRAAEAQETFKKYCAMCHGADLKGQTKIGQMRQIPDLTAADVRAKFDRARMIKSVTEGIKDKETGKERMKGYGGQLSEAEIAAVVDYVIAGPK